MKFKRLFAILLIAAFCSSCKQKQAFPTPEIIKSETKDSVSSYGPDYMVRSVRQAKNGDILIAGFKGVWRYDGKMFTNISGAIAAPSFWDVLEDRKGNLWFGTKDSGIYCYPADQSAAGGKSFLHYTTRQGLPSNMVLHLFEDSAGNIWFSVGGGVTRYNGQSFRHFTTKDGLANDGVNTFLEDKTGKLWMGTRGDACVYDGKTFTVFKNKDGQPFYNVWAIIEDQKGNIWFGGSIITDRKGSTLFLDEGLWRYDGSTYTKVSPKSTSAMIEDKKGNIWTTGSGNNYVANSWALSKYDQKSLYDKNPVVSEVVSNQRMLCRILEASDGSIWWGSGTGVYRYDGKIVTNFKNETSQP